MRNLGCIVLCVLFCLSSVVVFAGDLEAPATPTEAASAMYTLEDIYNRLNAGTAGAKRTGAFTEPSAGPGSTGYTLDEVMGKAPSVDDANGAGVSEVLVDKTFWGLTSGAWGTKTGTMPDREGDNASTAQGESGGVNYFTAPEGFYDGDDRVSATDAQVGELDANLSSDNIRSTVTIFGVAGNSNVVNTRSGDAAATDMRTGKKAWVDGSEVTGTGCAEVPRTGQTTSYATGDDGDLEKGVAWPSTRFTDNGDGTVTDNLTGLIWLKMASCNSDSTPPTTGTLTWTNALTFCNALQDGGCGLSDGSAAGEWRLPNRFELESLLDLAFKSPPLSNASGTAQWSEGDAFTGVTSSYYWSSTSVAGSTNNAWGVYMIYGYADTGAKAGTRCVWPVRGGQ